MFQKFDIRYKYDITFYQIKKKAELTRPRWPEAELTRGPRWKQAELTRLQRKRCATGFRGETNQINSGLLDNSAHNNFGI